MPTLTETKRFWTGALAAEVGEGPVRAQGGEARAGQGLPPLVISGLEADSQVDPFQGEVFLGQEWRISRSSRNRSEPREPGALSGPKDVFCTCPCHVKQPRPMHLQRSPESPGLQEVETFKKLKDGGMGIRPISFQGGGCFRSFADPRPKPEAAVNPKPCRT